MSLISFSPSLFRSVELSKPHCVDRWKVCVDYLPIVALVFSNPQASCCRTHHKRISSRIYIERMSIDQIISVLLRQSIAQHIECLATIAGARHNDLSVDRESLLVLNCRDKPCGVGIVWMDRDRKAKYRRRNISQLLPGVSSVSRAENPIVVLSPEYRWIVLALHHSMRILIDLAIGQIRRHVGRAHSFCTARPCFASIFGLPYTTGGNGNRNLFTVGGMNAD